MSQRQRPLDSSIPTIRLFCAEPYGSTRSDKEHWAEERWGTGLGRPAGRSPATAKMAASTGGPRRPGRGQAVCEKLQERRWRSAETGRNGWPSDFVADLRRNCLNE